MLMTRNWQQCHGGVDAHLAHAVHVVCCDDFTTSIQGFHGQMHEDFQKTRDISDVICCYMLAVVRRRKNMFRALLCQIATACALKILSEIVGVQDGRPQKMWIHGESASGESAPGKVAARQCRLTLTTRVGKLPKHRKFRFTVEARTGQLCKKADHSRSTCGTITALWKM